MSANERAECALTVDNQNINIDNEDFNHLYIEKILARRYNHNKKQYEYLLKFEEKDVDENMWLPAYKLKLVCCLKHRCVKWKNMKKKLNSCTSQSWFSELEKNTHHSKQVVKNRRVLCNGDDDSMHLSARKYQKTEFGSRKNMYHDKSLSLDGSLTQEQKGYWQ